MRDALQNLEETTSRDHFFPCVTLNRQSKRGNTPDIIVILYFEKQKRFVGLHCLEPPSLLCFMDQLRGERRLKKSKKQQQQNELKPQTNPSKIQAICAQNVWNFIFMLDFSIFNVDQ